MSGLSACLEKHKPNIDDLRRLEWSTTFDDLPDSREVKCYVHCIYVMFHFMNNENTNLDFTTFLDYVNALPKDKQNRYLKLGKKCFSKKIKDLSELAYYITICAKKNSNEDFHFFFLETKY